MLRLVTSLIMLATSATILLLLACPSGPPPDESQFKRDVAQMLVEAAKRSGGTVDGDDPIKTIVFDQNSIPPPLRDIEAIVKQGLEDAEIAWLDADLQGSARNLPGEWTTFGRDSTLKFNRTHSVVHLVVDGDGKQRDVEWGYVCGPVCGYGQRIRFQWSGNTWDQTIVAHIRY